MGHTNYIVAIEISSSKVTGAAGIETHNGIRIIATASTRAEEFISKGIVRNVDKTSEAITNIINSLEADISKEEGKDIMIKKAYVSLSGLTLRSMKSKAVRTFGTYTKITEEIISGLEDDNDTQFAIPEGYVRVKTITQEYKVDGKTDRAPIGTLAQSIEGHYLNILIKKQFLDQLNESFSMANTEIADSFIAARMDADIILTNDDRRNGCALVNIGADTTTIAIYSNDCLRKLAVLPLGSRNITRDLCSEQISYDQAETIKIGRGYKSPIEEKEPVDNETVNDIIGGRMCEILQNVKYQIEESGELIGKVVFTGGGSRLKNIELLIGEYMPEFKTAIASDPRLAFECNPGVNTIGVFTTALYGLMNHGKENCCEEIEPAPAGNGGSLFSAAAMTGNATGEENAGSEEEERKRKEEEKEKERKKKEEEERKKKEKEEKKKKDKEKRGNAWKGIGDLFKTFIQDATSEDPEQENENEDEE